MAKNEVIDDLGMHWRYSVLRGRIYCVEGKEELIRDYGADSMEVFENGYYADDFEDGVNLLKEYGYITKEKEL